MCRSSTRMYSFFGKRSTKWSSSSSITFTFTRWCSPTLGVAETPGAGVIETAGAACGVDAAEAAGEEVGVAAGAHAQTNAPRRAAAASAPRVEGILFTKPPAFTEWVPEPARPTRAGPHLFQTNSNQVREVGPGAREEQPPEHRRGERKDGQIDDG